MTDDGNATGSATNNVAPTTPATATYASDSFSRTSPSGWGTAPTGGAWTHVGAASLFAVGDGVGTVRNNAGSGPGSYLQSVSAANVDLQTSFSLDKQPTGSGVYVNAVPRRIVGQGAYFARTRIAAAAPAGSTTSAVSMDLARLTSAGSEVSLQASTTISGLTYTAGDVLKVRVQATGTSPTTIRAKVWKAGTPEPSTWTRSVIDSSAGIQAAGHVGISSYASGSSTNAPLTFKVNSLVATAP